MMTLRDLLQGLRPRIPDVLLTGPGWERLLQRIGDLPASAAVDLCGFEFKLGDPEPVADFSVVAAPGPAAHYYIANRESAALAETETWLGNTLAGRKKPDIWVMLAYDVVGIPEGRPAAPAVYLQSQATLPIGGVAFDPDQLADILGGILNRRDSLDESRALSRVFAAMPSNAVPVFAAVAPARVIPVIRLVIAEMTLPDLRLFLDRIDWTGSISTVVRTLTQIHDVSKRFMLSLDVVVGGGILPRIGFEIYPTSADDDNTDELLAMWLRTTQSDWQSLTNRLVDMELCLPAKADGLLSWPKNYKLFRNDEVYVLHMGINHFKLVIDENRLQVKGYAGLQCVPLNRISR